MLLALLIIATFYVDERDPHLYVPLRAYQSIEDCEAYTIRWQDDEGKTENGKTVERIVTSCMPFIPEQLVMFVNSALPSK